LGKFQIINRGSNDGRGKQTIGTESFGSEFVSRAQTATLEPVLIQQVVELGDKISYTRGSILFAEAENPRGVFLVLDGCVKSSVVSSQGKGLILGFQGPGTLLGLDAAILGHTYDATAETTEATTAIFFPRSALVKLLQENPKAAFEAMELLSRRCFNLLADLKSIGLAKTAEQRLAAFLLALRPDGKPVETLRLAGAKQEDLAQMVGLSRETASRLLSRLKKKQVLIWKRSTLIVRDWNAVERLLEPSETSPRGDNRRGPNGS